MRKKGGDGEKKEGRLVGLESWEEKKIEGEE